MKSLFPNRLRRTLFIACLTASLHGLLAAQGPISAVQEALRHEQVFFGESTGVLDEPTREALKRFQVRRGLPITGEIDGKTLQALEPASEPGRPVVRSIPPKTEADEAAAVVAVRDRAFLQDLQKAEAKSEPIPAPAPAAVAELPPPAAPEVPPTRGQGPVVVQTPPPDSPPVVAAPPEPVAAPPEPVAAPPEPVAAPPEPVATPVPRPPRPVVTIRKAEPARRVVEVEDPPLEPRGTRVIRSTTTTVDANGRTRIYETRTQTFANTPAPIIIRRAEPVEPRKKEGFFHRLFKGHDDDDDDHDD